MLRETPLDQCDHLARHCIGLEGAARRHLAGTGGAKGLAILSIEIPFSTERRILILRVHQHAVPPALLAIKILHAQ